MDTSPPQLMGLAIIALGALIVGWVALRRQPRAIHLFALALLVVALGYLATTGVPLDLVRTLFGQQY